MGIFIKDTMPNNTTTKNDINVESNIESNIEYDQVDFESIDGSDELEIIPNTFIDSQNGDTNEILAEMCFLEAEDLFSRGDRSGAISSYHQAHRYAPLKVNYCLKLIDLLSEDSSTFKEAEQILNKALALSPNNLELNIRLNKLTNKTSRLKSQANKEISGFLEQSEISTQKVLRDEIKAVALAMGVDLDKEAKQVGITQDTAAMLKEIDELETKSSTIASLSTQKINRENRANTARLQTSRIEENSKLTKPLTSDNPEDLLREIDELETKSNATGSLSAKKINRENRTNTTNTGRLQTSKIEENSKLTKPLTSDNPEDLLREIDELETKTHTGSFKAINLNKLSDSTVETKTGNLDRSKNPNKLKTGRLKSIDSKEGKRPKKISDARWLVLSLIFLIAAFGVVYEIFSKPEIILVGPAKENITDAKDIKFEWTCGKKGMQFVLEVYEGETFILKRFTKETSYIPTAQELEKFSPEHIYKWRVILPVGFAGDYKFASNMKTFSVAKVFEATSAPNSTPQNQQLAPTEQNTLPVEPTPKQKPKNKEITPVQRSTSPGEI